MGLPTLTFIFSFFVLVCNFLSAEVQDSARILHLMQNGQIKTSINLYEKVYQEKGEEDTALLEQIGLNLLYLGWRSSDPKIQMLTLFGASASGDEQAQPLLEDAVERGTPEQRLISLHLLSRFQNENSLKIIERAASSPFLAIRFEAVCLLAKQQSPKACSLILSLLNKVPSEILPVFPILFAQTGDQEAILQLKRMLSHPLLAVRVQATLTAAIHKRDDLLPEIRTLARHPRIEEQEAAAYTLGMLKDETSIDRLQILATSPIPFVKLSASRSLCLMGREKEKENVIQEALKEDPFAITLLGELPETEPFLVPFLTHSDRNIQMNAALALLEKGDARSLPVILPLLIQNGRDLGWSKTSSPGGTLHAWKTISSTQQRKNALHLAEESTRFREEIIQKLIKLPEQETIQAVESLLAKGETPLVRPLVELLETLRTKNALSLLKKYSQQPGFPLLRSWCSLALYRLQEEGPYRESLKEWIGRFHTHHLIQFEPMSPSQLNTQIIAYSLTPEETSRLLIESIEALVERREKGTIPLLLETIKNGNEKNRYALAGLLIHALH